MNELLTPLDGGGGSGLDAASETIQIISENSEQVLAKLIEYKIKTKPNELYKLFPIQLLTLQPSAESTSK